MRPQRRDTLELSDDSTITTGFNYVMPDLSKLENTDPSRFYYQATPDMVEQLKLVGYEVDERCPSRLPGHVTMSMPMELHRRREAHELTLNNAKAGAAMNPDESGLSARGVHNITRGNRDESNE